MNALIVWKCYATEKVQVVSVVTVAYILYNSWAEQKKNYYKCSCDVYLGITSVNLSSKCIFLEPRLKS